MSDYYIHLLAMAGPMIVCLLVLLLCSDGGTRSPSLGTSFDKCVGTPKKRRTYGS